jgi:hypothetical protein
MHLRRKSGDNTVYDERKRLASEPCTSNLVIPEWNNAGVVLRPDNLCLAHVPPTHTNKAGYVV